MRTLKAMRKDLVPDWSYVPTEIYKLSMELDKRCEDEMINLMKK
jgi:hypothetical protein